MKASTMGGRRTGAMVATLVSVHPLVYSKLEQPSSRLTGMLAEMYDRSARDIVPFRRGHS